MTNHLAEAARHEQAAHESFERCDTDGFLSQWAHGVMADKHRLQATLDAQGGRIAVLALFDLDGQLVPSKLIDTRYGLAFALLPEADWHARFTGEFVSLPKRQATAERKGYRVGLAWAPAVAVLHGATAVTVTAYARQTGLPVEVIHDGTGIDRINDLWNLED